MFLTDVFFMEEEVTSFTPEKFISSVEIFKIKIFSKKKGPKWYLW